MENHLKYVEIKNFKSIKDLRLECGRINVFVGKPNVGKSNILEAIGLLGACIYPMPQKFGEGIVRYEDFSNLITDKSRSVICSLETNSIGYAIKPFLSDGSFVVAQVEKGFDQLRPFLSEEFVYGNDLITSFLNNSNKGTDGLYWLGEVDNKGNYNQKYSNHDYRNPIKKYSFQGIDFNGLGRYPNPFSLFHPYGPNLFEVVSNHDGLADEVTGFFKEYGLDFVFDLEDRTFKISRREGNKVFWIPFSLSADTLQRMIFYKAAIASNQNSVLIFEEPESHSFPPYIRQLALDIAGDSSNQYFIASHNPYMVNTLIEKTDLNDIHVFWVDYEDYQTKIWKLTQDDISEWLDWGIDIFFNTDWIKSKHGVE
ncbi:MAG: AAA family ATPase [Bacteroidia bacterium]|nr:AAA family ATPase [Bacteroidia bacterium]